jgi:hypothetical protein
LTISTARVPFQGFTTRNLATCLKMGNSKGQSTET